ncbi:MAG: GGDEF domain-containing protein [Candidatus Aenigmarchaeota archaeon]|nr:GGDEF domain-containing protein [Candidatus Aenigmarchaeota archaeon]
MEDIAGLSEEEIAQREGILDSVDSSGMTQQEKESLLKYIKRMEADARTDPLTGALNRRGGQNIFGAHRLKQGAGSYAAALIDIDHFKKINDKYGHGVADRVLTKIHDVIRRGVRNTDTVIRYGGEEFAVLMPDTDQQGALNVIEKVRVSVIHNAHSYIDKLTAAIISRANSNRMSVEGYLMSKDVSKADARLSRYDGLRNITISGGVAYVPNLADVDSLENLLHSADSALYASKLERNKVLGA